MSDNGGKMPRVFLAMLFICGLTPLGAAVTQIHVGERTDFAEGKAFGKAGPYERITAKASFAIDPKDPANKIIADIGLAPVNEKGLVEFSADIIVLKPRDSKLGNGTVFYEVPNRGGQGALSMFNFGQGSVNPGDGYLMQQGYTIIWSGWQPDVPRNGNGLRLYVPNAKGVTGLVRSEIIVDTRTNSAPLGDRNHIPYPVVNPEDPSLTLTVRDTALGKKSVVARKSWHVDGDNLVLDTGFEPGRIYELVYPSKDPWIIGLGPAAIRDLISFFRYGGSSILFNEEHNVVKHAIGFGTSQSGRFLRAYLYYGFNADEKGRQVFDGIWPHVAGAGRGSFNNRFGQPSRDGHPHLNFLYPTDIYPFSDLPQADSGRNEGLLDKAIAAKVTPKIFYTNGSYEYWGRGASLIHTSVDGKSDAPLNRDSRAFLLAGTQHGPNAKPARNNTANIANPMDYRWQMRALLSDLTDWVANGKEPPASSVPRIDKDQLVSLQALNFPKVPGVKLPSMTHLAYHVDYGPEFTTKGIIAHEPPVVGAAFPILLPQVDRDGNETSGLRSPEQQVPLGSYTGWNLRDGKIGSAGTLYNMVGSFLPFAKTKADREKSGDPRPSIEERYKGKDDYLARIEAAAQRLVGERSILASDVGPIKEQAAKRWDFVMTQ
jgi:hypothetical protein